MQAIPLSIVLITLNEEDRIKDCLHYAIAGAELIVLDSGSKDQTVELARATGAKVYSRAFDDYASQRNAAISYATRPWILCIDADERLDASLKSAILEVVQQPSKNPCAYRMRRRLHYMGQTLRFGGVEDYPLRLFRKGTAYFEGSVHERLVFQGPQKLLSGSMLHYSYRNLDDYFHKFNMYTHKIAEAHYAKGKTVFLPKHVMRPFAEFFYRYVLRLGFLDGLAGLSYALISSCYAFVKYEKLRELQLKEQNYETHQNMAYHIQPME